MDKWSWSAPARPVFRAVALPLSIVSIVGGLLLIGWQLSHKLGPWNADLRVGVAALGYGTVLLLVALRGRLAKPRVNNRKNDS